MVIRGSEMEKNKDKFGIYLKGKEYVREENRWVLGRRVLRKNLKYKF